MIGAEIISTIEETFVIVLLKGICVKLLYVILPFKVSVTIE